jgi:AcrR family transcriptional regulator
MSRKNRTDVVAAARIMFAEQGFHGTSMRDLGKKLGLMGSSLYSHVVSKDELLVDVVREASSRFQALADEVATMSGTANERLSRLVHGHLQILVEDPHQARTFLNETRFLPEPERDKAVAMFDRYQQVFRDVLSSGCVSGEFRSDLDVHLAANLVLSLLNGTQRWFNADGALNVDSLALEVHFLLTLGLNPNPDANVA